MSESIFITPTLEIPLAEIVFRFSRSGGKGGQNVNKVETRVELLFDVKNSPSLSEEERRRLMSRLGSRLDSEGVLHIVAQQSRSQWQNRLIATEAFGETLRKALRQEKKRIATKAGRAARERRLSEKKRRGERKRLRRGREE
jgi:ribosome-associated protein